MSWLTRRRRRRLSEQPVPDSWAATLDRNVPLLRQLSGEQRRRLLGLTQVFLAEKSFEGAGGLDMTDEVRVTIAGQACLLLVGFESDIYPGLRSIVVYPWSFVAPLEELQPDGTVFEGPEERYGESWAHGTIVLSWEDVLAGAADPTDGENVVLHEFAHQLDEETGEANGVPLLPSTEMYAEWARVMTKEYEDLCEKVDRNRRTLIDPYASEDPAEFFAVATEFFFERPRDLKARHVALYDLFVRYYRQDPAARVAQSGASGTSRPRREDGSS